MLHRTVQVIINNVVVHQASVPADKVMMQCHKLKKTFCINQLWQHGIQAGVYYDNGKSMVEVKDAYFDGEAFVVQSKMNSEGFTEGPDWFDEKIYNK